jgi:hypothetical protein
MRFLALLVAAFALCSVGESQKKKTDVQVLECKARRAEDKIMIDGRVRVTAEKPLKGLVLAFDFLDSAGSPLATEKADVSEETLNPGDEPSIHASTYSPPGAIKYKIEAFDGNERELRVGNPGPFAIE